MASDQNSDTTGYSKWIFLPLVLAPVILFLPVLLPGKSLFWGITSIQFIPWHWAALNDIQQGILPLWNSLNGLGAPLAANYQSALFYPPTWLVLAAGWAGGITWMAWAHGLLIILHLIWAGWGMKSLTEYLGISPIPQLICGLAYGMCGYIVARGGFLTMVQSAAWIPWILLAVSQLAIPFRHIPIKNTKIQSKSAIWLALAFSGQWLSGHAQLAWYTILFCSAWLFYGAIINGGVKHLAKIIFLTLAAGLIAFMISSIQLLPTIEYFLQSQRSGVIDSQTALSYSFWPWRIITFLVPDFFGNPGRGDYWGYANYWEDAVYIGILPLFFAFLFFFRSGKKQSPNDREVVKPFRWFAGIIILIALIFALGWFTPVYPWLFEHIPTFGLFNAPARWMVLIEVCLILSAGFGAEEWIRHGVLTRKQINIWLTITLAGITGAAGAWFILPEINRTFASSILAMGGFLFGYLVLAIFKPKTGKISLWRILIVGWFSLDLLWAGYFLNPAIDSNLFTAGLNPVAPYSNGSTGRYYWDSIQENEQRFNRFFRFNDIRPTSDMYKLSDTFLPNINILSNISMLNNFDPMVPSRYAEYLQELTTSPVVKRNHYLELAGVKKVSLVNLTNTHEIYWEEINPLPEVRLVPCADFAGSKQESLQWIRLAAQENRLEDKIVVEGSQKDAGSCRASPLTDLPKITTVNLDKGLVIDIQDNPTEQWLMISRTWYPGWQAGIDGELKEILRADYLFMAMKVPVGNHKIELFYQPASFQIGRLLTICGILIAIVTLLISKKRKAGSFESE